MSTNYRAAEEAMDAFWEFKEHGHMARPIGLMTTLGYNQEVVDFVLNPDSYYFPNRRGETLVRPLGISDDKIPVATLENGVAYGFETKGQHRLQRIALRRQGYTEHMLGQLNDNFIKNGPYIMSSSRRNDVASVSRWLLPSLLHEDMLVESKPTLIFNYDAESDDRDAPCASVVAHEMTHLLQTLSQPELSPNDKLQRELERYAVQATLGHELAVPYSLSLAKAMEVDKFRHRYLGETAFEPDEYFRAEFSDQPLFETIGLSL